MIERFVGAVKGLTRPVLLLGTAAAAFYFFATGNAEGGSAAGTLFGVQTAWWFNERKETHEREALQVTPDPLDLLRAMPPDLLREMLMERERPETPE
ncbi:hypothetical protein LCGC14_0816640 [marine sediment metagenome]|uniref:Uncharacterized protein n=1 Tax=marine sediment metagenome TaxID=412755 RepID=A0A0F9Q5G2_9ZZZZ